MSYAKAGELLHLAMELSASHGGLLLKEIDRRWGHGNAKAARRRTQRILAELRVQFPDAYEEGSTDEGKWVNLSPARIGRLAGITAEDLASIDLGVAALQAIDHSAAERLAKVLQTIKISIDSRVRSRTDTDFEAILQTHHLAIRPGPRVPAPADLMATISGALLGMQKLRFGYATGSGPTASRIVVPYGVILGARSYLIARLAHTSEVSQPTRWRIDRMTDVRLLEEAGAPPADFNLHDYANRAFGSFFQQDDFQKVVWKFSPTAAPHAGTFFFHPDQRLEAQADGSLLVSFEAAGSLEMTWFLYQWGDQVEVLEPASLRQAVHPFRRGDFPGFP